MEKILITLIIVCAVFILLKSNMRMIPRCQEDVVIVGVGDFVEGRWDRYVCGMAVDDYMIGRATGGN